MLQGCCFNVALGGHGVFMAIQQPVYLDGHDKAVARPCFGGAAECMDAETSGELCCSPFFHRDSVAIPV